MLQYRALLAHFKELCASEILSIEIKLRTLQPQTMIVLKQFIN